ncbi:hypothetical protein [Streptomyces sp. NPDC096033]|uniref:hypothetical protein n=1 Tax=Streptomyces sp. NPDC096033 TaxID=3366071 RepID=UPI0038196EB1
MSDSMFLVLVAIFALALLLFVRRFTSGRRAHTQQAGENEIFNQSQFNDADDEIPDAIKRDYGNPDGILAIEALRDLITFPQHYVERIIEDVEVKPQALALTISAGYHLPGFSNYTYILLPLVWVQKGKFLFHLKMESQEDKTLCPISQQNTRQLLALIVEQMALEAYGNSISGDLIKAVKSFALTSRPISNSAVNDVTTDCDDLETKLRSSGQVSPEQSAVHEHLKSLCRLFAKCYLLAAEINPKRRMAIKVTYTLPVLRQLPRDKLSAKWRARLRVTLGARPNRVILPLYWPFWTANYHFRVSTEHDQYISDHKLVYVEAFTEKPINPPPQQLYRPVIQKGGLPFSHLYLRKFSTLHPQAPTPPEYKVYTDVDFAEVPPGVLGTSKWIAVLLAALAVGFALMYPQHISYLMPAPNPNSPPELQPPTFPAFLFAFLALVASWVGAASEREAVLRSSLAARFGLMTTAFLTLVGSLLYVSIPEIDSITCTIIHYRLNWLWMIFSILCLINASWLYRVYRKRAKQYIKSLQRVYIDT